MNSANLYGCDARFQRHDLFTRGQPSFLRPPPCLPADVLSQEDLQRSWLGRGKAPGKDCSLWLVKDMGVQAVPNLRQAVGEFLTAGFVAKTDGRQ